MFREGGLYSVYIFILFVCCMACGILILQLGFDHALVVTAPGPNHWTARGFPTALPFQGAAGVFSVGYDMVTILTIPRLL